MTTSTLPASPAAFALATWEDVAAYYDELAGRPLDDESLEPWLQAWSTLEELLTVPGMNRLAAEKIKEHL